MNQPTTLLDVLAPLIILGLCYLLYLAFRTHYTHYTHYTTPTSRATTPLSTALAQKFDIPGFQPAQQEAQALRQRMYVAYADNPHSHPFDELGLDKLIEHLYDQHWEVWNTVGEKDPMPSTLRREHAADHGLVLR